MTEIKKLDRPFKCFVCGQEKKLVWIIVGKELKPGIECGCGLTDIGRR